MNKKVTGILFSYILIVVDSVVGLLLVPLLLRALGDEEYGTYKLLVSTASYLAVLDFGIGGTITRYVVKYNSENDKRSEQNFVAMGLIIYALLSVVILALASVIALFIPRIYSSSISADHMGTAQQVFMVLCATTSVQLFNHAYNGLITAYEHFSFIKIANIAKALLRIMALYFGFAYIKNAMTVVSIDFALAVGLLVCNVLYAHFKVKCKVKLYRWDWSVAKEAGLFTLAILLQSVINQFNTNVDNIVLGIYSTASTIAIYSIALQLYSVYASLSTAISSVFLPAISRAVFNGADSEEITDRVIEPSRIQLFVLLLALSGFVLYGREFIVNWVGEGYDMVYVLACMLFTAATLELSQNSITSVLKAKNMLHGKTKILAVSTAVNVLLTVVLVPKIDAIGAVIGTVFSMFFGYGIALNIYYQKKVGINMKRYYKKTYSSIVLVALSSLIPGYAINRLISRNGLMYLIIKAGLFALLYCTLMILFGLTSQEKKYLQYFGRLKRDKRKEE